MADMIIGWNFYDSNGVIHQGELLLPPNDVDVLNIKFFIDGVNKDILANSVQIYEVNDGLAPVTETEGYPGDELGGNDVVTGDTPLDEVPI